MKVTLIEAVRANIEARKMDEQGLSYSLSLALMKIKRATQTEVEYFAREERKLVEQYAARDEDGNVELKNGRFVFRSQKDIPAYEAARKKLGDTETDVALSRITVEAPKTITPAALEALSVFIRFKEGGRKT